MELPICYRLALNRYLAALVVALAGCASHEPPPAYAKPAGLSPYWVAEGNRIKAMERELLENAIRDIHTPPVVRASAGTLEDRVSELEYQQRLAAIDARMDAVR